MKSSKTLVILLVIPFAIALLSFISVVVLNNTVAADITDIIWPYQASEGYKISSEPYKLEATAEIDESLILAPGNELTWFTRNINKDDTTEYAKIVENNKQFYLYALQEGQVEVVCQNVRGTVSKYFTATIYEKGAIIVNTKTPRSGSSVDKNIYFGQYDLVYDSIGMDKATSKEATIGLVPTILGDINDEIFMKSNTPNAVSDGHNVIVKGEGKVEIEFYTNGATPVFGNFEFISVKDAYNVYSYNDLLMCTNFSTEGKNVVLQTNLESLKNTYVEDNGVYKNIKLNGKESTNLFGNFDFNNQKFNFENEIVTVPSTYNTKFIKQYNEFNGANYTNEITVGLHVKKDIYGNGFTINAHGLAYPNHGSFNEVGKFVPTPGKDYFFGPLAFVTIGSLIEMPVVKAYGQDNALIYLDGSSLTINDLKVRNTNEIDNMYNLLYTGSVIDINGHNNTIKNSIISNGRNVIRAYSADGLNIDNCILKNAAQFLLSLGSNNFTDYNKNQTVKATFNGKTYSDDFTSFYSQENTENGAIGILDQIFSSPALTDMNVIKSYLYSLNQIQNGLDNLQGLYDEDNNLIFSDTINVSRSYFSNSGMFSISFESMFNGPFLYNSLIPSSLLSMISMFKSTPPNEIGGTSTPVNLIMDDKTKFYDWKDIDSVDVSIMIEENISSIIKMLAGKDIPLSMEDFFPLRSYLKDLCRENGYLYKEDGKQYLNTKYVWYGGGKNYSKVSVPEESADKLDLSKGMSINLMEGVLQGKYISTIHPYVLLLSKCVCLATGFNPFKFITNGKTYDYQPEEFKKVPKVEDLMNNVSKEDI